MIKDTISNLSVNILLSNTSKEEQFHARLLFDIAFHCGLVRIPSSIRIGDKKSVDSGALGVVIKINILGVCAPAWGELEISRFKLQPLASKSTNLSVRVSLEIDLRDIANGFPDVL
ncbi:hypothetical protein V1478_009673 [Vespula squamosa]|uniref:Uncharacterized protein n=1 Tax=Vespula squamosa TaxID=30214 RepID=A0ABD2AT35_VESSQ